MAAGKVKLTLVLLVALVLLLTAQAFVVLPAPTALRRSIPSPSSVVRVQSQSRASSPLFIPLSGRRAVSGPLVVFSEAAPAAAGGEQEAPKGAMGRLKQWWKKTAKIDRKKMAELGVSAVLSYGLISNLNYCGTLCAAKIIFEKKNGVSPFAPGQWKAFLAIYGGLWAAMNFVRPLRVWLALGLTPYFDKLIQKISAKFGMKKAVALGAVVFFVNILGTFAFLGTGLYLSSVYTGVPLVLPFLNKAAAGAV